MESSGREYCVFDNKKPQHRFALRRGLALLLVLCMTVLGLPFAAFAEYDADGRDKVRVGFFAMDGYHMMDEAGNKSGYGYDVLRLMARYWDVDYEYVGYDKGWSETQQMIEDGEIDMGTSARKTPEREERFDYSRPIGNNECMMTVRSDNDTVIVQDYATYNGLRVAMLNGNTRNADFEEFAAEKHFNYIPVYFNLVSDMENALQTGQVDAIVSSSMRATKNERMVERFNNEEIYIIVKKGNRELLDKINYAIDQMNAAEGDWKTELFNRYYTSLGEKNLEFTEEEKALLAQYRATNRPLRVLCDPTRKPYSYLENGEMKGILPDYFRKLAEIIGLPYQFVHCSTREEYVAGESKIDAETIDLILDARLNGDANVESKNFGVTAPYITVRSVRVVRRDFDGEIKTVATVDQGASGSIEDVYAPNAEKLLCASRQEAMQAVKSGKADAAFVYYYMAQEFINNDPSSSLVYSLLDQPSFEYCILTAPHMNHALAGILTKAIYAQPDRTIENIASGYTSYKMSDMTLKMLVQLHPIVALVMLAVVFLLLALFAVLTFVIRAQNRKLNGNLEKIKRDKQILDRLCTDFTAVYYIDLDTGAYDVLKVADQSNANGLLKGKEKDLKNFDDFVNAYGQAYLPEDMRAGFVEKFCCANLKASLQKADRTSFHYTSVPNGNGHRFFDGQAIRLKPAEGGINALLGFRYIDDIIEKEKTVQNQLQQALDEAELKNEIISAIAKSYQAIYRVDLQQDFFEEISSDGETHHLTGYQGCASEKFREACNQHVAPEYRALVLPFLDVSTLAERLKTEEFITTEYRMCDGNWHRLRFIAKKRDEAGNVTHVLCTVRSTSDAKQRELNLVYQAEAAKREADMKSRFLATMSHDIRTPLNGIIGMITLAEQYADNPEMQHKTREKALESLNYLVSLVNDVLDMNKIQSGELKNQELAFNLADVLRDLNRLYTQRAAGKGIAYKVNWDNANIRYASLIGNPVYLGRILSNIMDNAIKFSPAGSTITVSGTEEMPDKEHVLVTFRCKDQGVGMSEDFAKHAFDMFAQEKEDSRTRYEGTGLGLSIVKQLVDRMGGTIELQSKLGVGTTVTVKLPFKIGQEEIGHKADCYEGISVQGVRALIAEDNELNREIACCILENSGMEVTCAEDGQEAVELFAESAPGYFGVIYMDIMMPRMNGLDAARAIRAMDRRDAGDIPIIAMSANAFAEDIINSRLAGINVHLAKPLDEEKMVAALKQCIADNVAVKLHEAL